MDLPLPPDFKEFLQLLASERIEYLLVGGYAVGYHGYPRPTGDLDIWIAMEPANAARMLTVLAKFGFAHAGATEQTFLTAGQIVRMGVPPVRIEVLNSISGVNFAECRSRAIQALVDGVLVWIIHREDLIANKRAAGRNKDLNDVTHLEQGPSSRTK